MSATGICISRLDRALKATGICSSRLDRATGICSSRLDRALKATTNSLSVACSLLAAWFCSMPVSLSETTLITRCLHSQQHASAAACLDHDLCVNTRITLCLHAVPARNS